MHTEPLHHPGALVRRLLAETGLSVTDAAKRLKVSRSQLQRLLGRQSGVSAEMALRLAAVFGVDARAYLDRQTEYDLALARCDEARRLKSLKPYAGKLRARDRERVVGALRAREAELRGDGIAELYLFGSVARGDARAESDIDLCYRAAPGGGLGLIQLGEIADRLSVDLGAPVDLTPVDSLKAEIRARALEDAIQVF